jgi:hypothetical protein
MNTLPPDMHHERKMFAGTLSNEIEILVGILGRSDEPPQKHTKRSAQTVVPEFHPTPRQTQVSEL